MENLIYWFLDLIWWD